MDQGGAGPGWGEAPSPQRMGVGDAPWAMPVAVGVACERSAGYSLLSCGEASFPRSPRSSRSPRSPRSPQGKHPSGRNASPALLGHFSGACPMALLLARPLMALPGPCLPGLLGALPFLCFPFLSFPLLSFPFFSLPFPAAALAATWDRSEALALLLENARYTGTSLH